MNFTDRIALGKTLARDLEDLRGKDAVVLCLKDSSLSTCLAIAIELRAWVYPLVYVPIISPDNAHRTLGAINESGTFCLNPELDTADVEQMAEMTRAALKDQKDAALEAIKQQMEGYGMTLDKHCMDGRDVIIAGDIVTSPVPLAVAAQLLNSVKPKSLTAVMGNVTPEVAEQVRISADKTNILDVISGVTFDDNHYFERPDAFSPEQKHLFTQHIAAYWQ